jgi:transcriptional regulator with AAA-type ATPase domain
MPIIKMRGSELATDLCSGMSDHQLMEKYGLTPETLNSVFLHAIQSGIAGVSELLGRNGIAELQVQIENSRKLHRYSVPFPVTVKEYHQLQNQGTIIDISTGGMRTKGLRAASGKILRLEIPVDWYGVDNSLLLEANCRWCKETESHAGPVAGFEILHVIRGDFRSLLGHILFNGSAHGGGSPVPILPEEMSVGQVRSISSHNGYAASPKGGGPRCLLGHFSGCDSPGSCRSVEVESANPAACLLSTFTPGGMTSLIEIASTVALTEGTVLLYGESGVGKDYWALFIHQHSRRADKPFISINCAAIPHELAESELFGHEAGAFTGAGLLKHGLLESAHGGTLLLNEVGELPMLLQAKLLTFLDDMQFRRVGGQATRTVDIRILVATNRDLKAEVREGRFREDLFHRLNVLPIRIPPLRERIDDLPALIDELLASLCQKLGLSTIPSVNPHTLTALKSYPWPGNIRELRNKLERSLILSGGKAVDPIRMFEQDQESKWSLDLELPETTDFYSISREVKCRVIVEALRRTGGKRQKTAELLGITRFALRRQMATLGIAAENRS